MRYTKDYQERRTLPDGTRLILRMVRPSDKTAFTEGLARLSPQARYQRFMAPKNGFTQSELAFLTEVDGHDHIAIVAGHERPGAEPEGVGVCRIVRSDDDPQSAEFAIVVFDAWQRRGIGRLLLERAVAAAAERGIRRIRAQVRADNRQVRGLLKDYLTDSQQQMDHGVLTIEFPIPDHNVDAAVDTLLELIRALAQCGTMAPELIGELAVHPVDTVALLLKRLKQCRSRPESVSAQPSEGS